MQKKVAIITLGCKLNQYESMGIEESLEHAGYKIVNRTSGADYYIVNTCTVTAKTDRRSRHAIRQALSWNPNAKIIVTGCGSQRNAREFEHLPNVMLISGNREKIHIPDLIADAEKQTSILTVVDPISEAPFENIPITRFRNYKRAFVKIQDGCDRACSYCVIPSVRGPSRSQQPHLISEEIQSLVRDGSFKEIVLTGVDLGTYGLDLSPATSFLALLKQLVEVDGLQRIRLSSIEPMEFHTDLIDFVTTYPKICKHFHIPLQSGSDTILSKMNRNYTSAEFLDIVTKIKIKEPASCIGADVITAFPGETLDLFEETHAFLCTAHVDYLHVFTYSDRPGTPASRNPEKTTFTDAKDRTHILRALGNEKAIAFRTKMLHQPLQSIILTAKHKQSHLPIALTHNYIQVQIRGRALTAGSIVDVKIEEVRELECLGTCV
jgi:threonylcarbamoyladenosine tRNA methylthiotransferase MtaB